MPVLHRVWRMFFLLALITCGLIVLSPVQSHQHMPIRLGMLLGVVDPNQTMAQNQSQPGSNFPGSNLTVNIARFGANGADLTDDTPAVQAALDAAAQMSANQNNGNVNVFFPAGRYFLSTKGLVVPSYVTLLGDAAGESVIVNRPQSATESFVFSTRDFNTASTYLSIARADDTAAHPALPNHSYEGLNYIYLKDLQDVQTLRGLGVPANINPAYPGLKVAIASGATLGNNYGTAVSQDSAPKMVLQKDNGVNPAPVISGTLLAIDAAGKATLKEPNRFNWGIDAHVKNESLGNYYWPSRSHRQEHAVTGPAWLVPIDHYHHDIAFKNLVFEADATRTNDLYGAYGLYIGYAYNVEVSQCKFRNIPGDYPLLVIRTHNVLIQNNRFNVQGYRGITLDAGSDYTLVGNQFIGENWSNGTPRKLPLQAINFIEFDENPIEISVIDNQFSTLKFVSAYSNRSGQAIAGRGGAYLKVINNKFTRIDRSIIQTFGFNSNVIIDSNVIENSSAFLFPGTGAGMAHLYNNTYSGNVSLRQDGAAFDSYNYDPNRTNYVVKNRGVTINQWYYPTSYVAGNTDKNGTPITQTPLIDVNGTRGTHEVVQVGQNQPSAAAISSISLSRSEGQVGSLIDVTVSLSAPPVADFPFYLMLTDGDRDIARIQKFLLSVPKGKQQVTIPNAVLGMKRGAGTITAKPLCATSTRSASARLRIG